MDELIKEACEMYDVDPKTLSSEEKATIAKEIQAEERGELITAPILQDIMLRDIFK